MDPVILAINQLSTTLQGSLAVVNTSINKLEARIGKVEAGLADVETGLADVKTSVIKLEARTEKVEAGLADVETGLADVKTSVIELEARTEKVEAGLADVNTTLGFQCEQIIKRTVESKYGQKFAESFLCESLFGLARISFPKKSSVKLPSNLNEHDENQLQQNHVKALVDVIFEKKLYETARDSIFDALAAATEDQRTHFLKLKEDFKTFPSLGKEDEKHAKELLTIAASLEQFINSPNQKNKKQLRSCREGLKKLAIFYKTDPTSRPFLLASNSRVGVMCITSQFVSPPYLSLEFDCRGMVSIYNEKARIEIGEIKKDIHTCRSKAQKQLKLRLQTMKFCLETISKRMKIKLEPETELIGRIFHATRHVKENGTTIETGPEKEFKLEEKSEPKGQTEKEDQTGKAVEPKEKKTIIYIHEEFSFQ